jgi:hypothetical protein
MSKKPRKVRQWLTADSETNVSGTTHVRLRLVYVDWVSAMKMSFLVGIVQGVVIIVATAILHVVLVQTGLFSAANAIIGSVIGGSGFDVNTVLSFGQTVAFAAVIGILNMVVITVMGGIVAVIYNVIAKMTGGIKVGLSDK